MIQHAAASSFVARLSGLDGEMRKDHFVDVVLGGDARLTMGE